MKNYLQIAEKSSELISGFKAGVKEIPHEKKGVLYSDILFMLACLDGTKVPRILESGRARGQSTILLASSLPKTEIISIEYDRNSPDVAIANERLKGFNNVTLLFGDSRVIMPKMLKEGDVVVIDGPKMFLAVRLAIKLLRSKKVSSVFLHDMTYGTVWRSFLEKFFPEARFSDQVDVARITSQLDESLQNEIPIQNRMGRFEGQFGYGYALAYIPFYPGRPYFILNILALFRDFFEPQPMARLLRKIRHIFPQKK